MMEDFKKDIKNSLREMRESTSKQVEALREETQKSLKELQENTTKEVNELITRNRNNKESTKGDKYSCFLLLRFLHLPLAIGLSLVFACLAVSGNDLTLL